MEGGFSLQKKKKTKKLDIVQKSQHQGMKAHPIVKNKTLIFRTP